jgi:hypothetical protein
MALLTIQQLFDAYIGDGIANGALGDLYHAGLESLNIVPDQVKAQKYWKKAIDAGKYDRYECSAPQVHTT